VASSAFGGTVRSATAVAIGWDEPGSRQAAACSHRRADFDARGCESTIAELARPASFVPYHIPMIVWAVIFGFVCGATCRTATLIGAAIIHRAGSTFSC